MVLQHSKFYGRGPTAPFYSLREFSLFILISVYIPPQACVTWLLQDLADQVKEGEKKHLQAHHTGRGSFNRVNHCYSALRDSYHSVPRTALGLSDHCIFHLIPIYRQKSKCAKPVVKTVKRWTAESKLGLQACFCCTDWSVFEYAVMDLSKLTDAVTSYISFGEDSSVQTETFCIYNNKKPWCNTKMC